MRLSTAWISVIFLGLGGCVWTPLDGVTAGSGEATTGESGEATTGEFGDVTTGGSGGVTTGVSGGSGHSEESGESEGSTTCEDPSAGEPTRGSTSSTSASTSGEREELCGDGVVDPGEACDDGDLDNSDGCLDTCELAACGDGYLHAGVEACDDGNEVEDDFCTSDCVAAACDDGVRNGAESDVDCGGFCAGCEIGGGCDDDLDCDTGECLGGFCVSARHCRDVRDLGLGDGDGIYRIDSDGPDGPLPPVEVHCEMTFEGGGWTAIFSRGAAPGSFAAAADFAAALAAQADAGPVAPGSESAAIRSVGLDLADLHEVVFAWAPSVTGDPTRYAILSRDEGLVGLCMVDGTCPGATPLGIVDVLPGGEAVEVFTGDPLAGPQVGLGLGVGDQAIVWGYDRRPSAAGHWGNWRVDGPPGIAGNTAEIADDGWRYAIYLR